MTILADGQTAVNKLRARGAGLDPLLARVQLQSVLSAVELRPAGLPPSAILCVRAMADPLGGVVTIAGGARPPAAWQHAATAALDRLARQAARPARAPVPAGAEAVLFADRAELLAQLAQDWCTGTLTTRWWWQALFPGDTARAVVPAWLAMPTQIPAALAHLAGAGASVAFLTMLDAGAVDDLLVALTQSYGLSEVRAARDRWRRSPAAPPAASDRGEVPWRRWVPEAGGPGLTPDRELLLGIGLLLWRVPAAVRTPSFGGALATWSGFTARPTPRSPAGEVDHASIETEPQIGAAGGRPSTTDVRDDGTDAAPVAPRLPDDGLESDLAPPVVLVAPDALAIGDPDVGPANLTACEFERAETEPLPRPFEALQPDLLDVPMVDTAFGGVFFLINLAIGLGLYGDFTTPAEPGISLSPWDFLALLGRRMTGGQIEHDPIWPVLAGLAGRSPEDEPGAGFHVSADWRLPPGWLDPFVSEDRWSWAADEHHVVVEHPAGFTVLDLGLSHVRGSSRSRSRQLARLLQRELASYPNAARPPPELGLLRAIGGSPLARWLDRLVSYIEARLAEALLIERNRVAELVLRYPARVFVSAVSVDLNFSLTDLPIEVRLSGLDRDPGWLPAGSRVVTFHFE